MTDKHTPTPWKLMISPDKPSEGDEIQGATHPDKYSVVCCNTQYYPTGVGLDDMKFIVKAVNSHNDMLEALKLCDAVFNRMDISDDLLDGCSMGDDEHEAWQAVSEAIKKAEV